MLQLTRRSALKKKNSWSCYRTPSYLCPSTNRSLKKKNNPTKKLITNSNDPEIFHPLPGETPGQNSKRWQLCIQCSVRYTITIDPQRSRSCRDQALCTPQNSARYCAPSASVLYEESARMFHAVRTDTGKHEHDVKQEEKKQWPSDILGLIMQ